MWVTPRQHKLIGQCLADVRARAEITQAELAKKLGKAQSFVSSYESGQRRIDLKEFLLITAALKADPRKIFAELAKIAGY